MTAVPVTGGGPGSASGGGPGRASGGGRPGGKAGVDEHGAGVVRRAGGALRTFNAAGVLGPTDVHVAATLGRLCGEADEAVLLAAALAVRAPRLGHVCVDLATVRETATVEGLEPVDAGALPWPGGGWAAAVGASPLVATADGDGARPLRLDATRLYLDRYWRHERHVLADVGRRAGAPRATVDVDRLRAGLDRLLPAGEADDQRLAAATAVLRHLAVVAGGPGTGKTTTVATVLALLADQRTTDRFPRVGLAAPTGKAADRVEKAVRRSVERLDVDDDVRAWLLGLRASTLHRLLGRRPGSDTRFRHDRENPLPLDVVVVDEASMVSLAMMARLLEAVGPGTRLVLLGDPDQLASVEAGAVLGDVIGPARSGPRMRPAARAELATATGADLPGDTPEAPLHGPAIGDAIVVLRRRHRFAEGSGIAALAEAIQRGDAEETIALLDGGNDDLRWIPVHAEAFDAPALAPVRAAVAAAGAPVVAAARAGDAAAALEALGGLRLLCAHRRGPSGVAEWVPAVERWLARSVDGLDVHGTWYLGRPVLVTRNDYQLNLRNGDVGVVVAGDGGEPTVAFASADGVRLVSPVRLDSYETVHAMTVHKSQGSQFRSVVVVLPEPGSPILTRELLYTAVTRAESSVTVVGTDEAVRAAVERPIQRASGLRAALWGDA